MMNHSTPVRHRRLISSRPVVVGIDDCRSCIVYVESGGSGLSGAGTKAAFPAGYFQHTTQKQTTLADWLRDTVGAELRCSLCDVMGPLA